MPFAIYIYAVPNDGNNDCYAVGNDNTVRWHYGRHLSWMSGRHQFVMGAH